MRILVIANSSKGLLSFRRELLTELCREHEIILSAPDNGSVDELRAIGCSFLPMEMDRRGISPKADLRLLLAYWKQIQHQKPDLVITYTIKPNIYSGAICRLLGVPYAVNITGLGTAFENEGWLKKLVTVMYKIALKRAKVVFFENSENRRLFVRERIVTKAQTCLLHGAGVNLEHFTYAEYPKDQDEIRFLFMGRVMREKGVDELFRAMRLLQKDGVPCSLDLLGGYEEDYESVIMQGEQEGWLRYHGYQADVRPFIANSHCFVLPSWHEGMANTNLESAATGRPLITSRIPGCQEAVANGKSGLLCEAKNADSLYAEMKRFVELPWETKRQMGINGRRYVEMNFDKKDVVAKTISRLI